MNSKFKNDNHFEECVVQALISDHQFAEQMTEVLNVDYFNLEHLKQLTKSYFEYHEKHKVFPSLRLLVTIAKNDFDDEIVKEKVLGYLFKILKTRDENDLFYAKEQALEFCKKRALFIALEKSLQLIEDNKFEQIVEPIQKAIQAGSERDIGHFYAEGLDKRMEIEAEVGKVIPTPYEQINAILKRGGIPGKKLCVVCAPTGLGKSHMLVDIGQHAAKLGFNVVHYTLELDDVEIGSRYDARISTINSDKLLENKEIVREKLKEVPGYITIKMFSTATVNTIRNHLNRLRMVGRYPDLIIIDYADLMRSQHHYDQRRLEEEAVYRDLRALSMELDIPIWTATQTNREGLDVEVITKKHVAEAFGKIMVSDLWITMSHKYLFVAKSRLGPDNKKFPVSINTAISKIDVFEPATIESFEEETSVALLRDKFRDYQKINKSNFV